MKVLVWWEGEGLYGEKAMQEGDGEGNENWTVAYAWIRRALYMEVKKKGRKVWKSWGKQWEGEGLGWEGCEGGRGGEVEGS